MQKQTRRAYLKDYDNTVSLWLEFCKATLTIVALIVHTFAEKKQNTSPAGVSEHVPKPLKAYLLFGLLANVIF